MVARATHWSLASNTVRTSSGEIMGRALGNANGQTSCQPVGVRAAHGAYFFFSRVKVTTAQWLPSLAPISLGRSLIFPSLTQTVSVSPSRR